MHTLQPLICAIRIRATSRTRGCTSRSPYTASLSLPTAAPNSGERLHTCMSSPPSPSGTLILAICAPPGSARAYDVPGLGRPAEQVRRMSVVAIRENGRVTTLPLPLLPAGPVVHPALEGFHPAVAEWFRRRFPEGPTAPQIGGWPLIASGVDTLIAAPTGSGKTLAGFLVAIDSLYRAHRAGGDIADIARVVYVSPLKALAV